MQQMIFIVDLIACSTCFGHHYAHHQELESIIQMVAACGIWCFGFQVVGMVWSWGLCDHLYNTLELLMMGIMVPETCWASNKICNKYHLLHLVGILFPHINFVGIKLTRESQNTRKKPAPMPLCHNLTHNCLGLNAGLRGKTRVL